MNIVNWGNSSKSNIKATIQCRSENQVFISKSSTAIKLLRASPISDFRTKLGICPNQPVCESRPPWLGKEKTTFSENPSWATPLNKVERWTVLNLVDCSLSHTLGIYQKANYCKIPLKCQRCDRCLERWSSDICKQNSRRTVMTAFLVQYQVIILQQSFFSLQTGHLTQN